MKKFLAVFCSIVLALLPVCEKALSTVFAEEEETTTGTAGIEISAPSAILMEVSTGQILFEKDAETQRPPASVTKIMTMLLICDALKNGKISSEDPVPVSEYAASMGGSQVFLEPGETQTVDTMLKCISIASANDAAVAMAEYIGGSEEAFVQMMNDRAAGLGMAHTRFVNCNGLDAQGHVTTAGDIAKMSRELICQYPEIRDYCMTWMDTITHTTRNGSSEFGLTNTNKLVRQYPYATGLKTGSTSEAKFCVSATAEKDGISLIAVIMAADSSKQRFADATALLNYGFGTCQIYEDENPPALPKLAVKGGVREEISCEYAEPFRYVDTSGALLTQVTSRLEMKTSVAAPVKKGEKAGELIYELDGRKIGSVVVRTAEACKKAEFTDYLKKVFTRVRI